MGCHFAFDFKELILLRGKLQIAILILCRNTGRHIVGDGYISLIGKTLFHKMGAKIKLVGAVHQGQALLRILEPPSPHELRRKHGLFFFTPLPHDNRIVETIADDILINIVINGQVVGVAETFRLLRY